MGLFRERDLIERLAHLNLLERGFQSGGLSERGAFREGSLQRGGLLERGLIRGEDYLGNGLF